MLTPGGGLAVQADARAYAASMAPVDLAYLDPPYNQHRYHGNYHVWETLIRWDAPAHYGVARKRVDARDPASRSPFNSRRTIHAALAETIAAVPARVVVASVNDEGFVTVDELAGMARARGAEVRVLAFEARRYVGSVIGVHSPAGVKVGTRAGAATSSTWCWPGRATSSTRWWTPRARPTCCPAQAWTRMPARSVTNEALRR